jgi:MFS superfamily sulfate permease-like transporter
LTALEASAKDSHLVFRLVPVLEELDSSLNAQGIALVFAEMKDPVRRKIERYGLARKIEARHFFPTIGAAVAAFRDETGAQWTAPSSPPPADRQGLRTAAGAP